MESSKPLYDYDRLVEFRHDLHKNPELFFQEVRTSGKIIEYLKSIGIEDNQIRRVAKTGIIVDIKGKGKESGKPYCVALRADMDALPIQEKNSDIDYASTNGNGHMCGHDMHVTCLVAGTTKLMEKIDQIPSDKCIRLLFQPAEERHGGALPMIQEGALDGVDEVYGFHNWPLDKPGKIICKNGCMMAACTDIEINITGKGGHASMVDILNDPLQAAVDIQVGLRELVTKFRSKGYNFTTSLPCIKTAEAPNVIAEKCYMSGKIRTFDDDVTIEIKKSFEDMVRKCCLDRKCTVDLMIKTIYPATINTDNEAEHVRRVAKKVLGENNVVDDERVPVYASEDFSYFTKYRPGAFFFMTSARKDTDKLHTNCFNPDDSLITYGSDMWYHLVLDRFGLEL